MLENKWIYMFLLVLNVIVQIQKKYDYAKMAFNSSCFKKLLLDTFTAKILEGKQELILLCLQHFKIITPKQL